MSSRAEIVREGGGGGRTYLSKRGVLRSLVDDLRGHAGVDDNAALGLALDPELGSCARSVEHAKDVGAVNVVEVFLRELSRGLHDGDTSILIDAQAVSICG